MASGLDFCKGRLAFGQNIACFVALEAVVLVRILVPVPGLVEQHPADKLVPEPAALDLLLFYYIHHSMEMIQRSGTQQEARTSE